jgi:hypothetical protein
MSQTNDKTSSETTSTTTKQEIESADEEELTTLISELIHEMNLRPDSNPAQTGEIVHRLLKSARDIQGLKNGLITKTESLRIAVDEHNKNIFAQAAAADSKAAADSSKPGR